MEGHAGVYGNMRADELAVAGAMRDRVVQVDDEGRREVTFTPPTVEELIRYVEEDDGEDGEGLQDKVEENSENEVEEVTPQKIMSKEKRKSKETRNTNVGGKKLNLEEIVQEGEEYDENEVGEVDPQKTVNEAKARDNETSVSKKDKRMAPQTIEIVPQTKSTEKRKKTTTSSPEANFKFSKEILEINSDEIPTKHEKNKGAIVTEKTSRKTRVSSSNESTSPRKREKGKGISSSEDETSPRKKLQKNE